MVWTLFCSQQTISAFIIPTAGSRVWIWWFYQMWRSNYWLLSLLIKLMLFVWDLISKTLLTISQRPRWNLKITYFVQPTAKKQQSFSVSITWSLDLCKIILCMISKPETTFNQVLIKWLKNNLQPFWAIFYLKLSKLVPVSPVRGFTVFLSNIQYYSTFNIWLFCCWPHKTEHLKALH